MNRRNFIRTIGICIAIFTTTTIASAEPSPEPHARLATFAVSGMMTPSCPTLLKAAVSRMDGVIEVTASLPQKKAWVRFRPDVTSPAAIIETIGKKTSYEARLVQLTSE